MNKNVKSMFFVLTLVTLLIAVGAVSAADDADSTNAFDSSVSDAADSGSTYVAAESVQTTSDDNKVDTNTMEKEEKDIKTETKTVNVNNLNELVNTITNAGIDTKNEEYIINLNDGTYNTQAAFVDYMYTASKPNIIINANSHTLEGMMLMLGNGCNITLNDATLQFSSRTDISGHNTVNDEIYTFNNVYIKAPVALSKVTLILSNCTVNSTISNGGKLVINDDMILGENFGLSGSGSVIINDTNVIYPYVNTFSGKSTLNNITINKSITNNGEMTLNNVTVNSTITNNDKLIISDDTSFGDNCVILGNGEIEINDTNRIAPYFIKYNGDYTINNVNINSDKKNYANLTIINSTINSKIINNIEGRITVINSTIDGEIVNYGVIILDNVTNTDNIINYGDIFEGSLPENYVFKPTAYIVNNDTADVFFDVNNGGKLTDVVEEGDTLDFQGTISHVTGLSSLVINKPVNIITSTNNGRIESFSSITYNNESSGSNITGLYTYNTQFYVTNAHDMVFDNISNVVNSARIGWNVGQTSIRENSTNITVKNSYFYTKDNGGSSTLVFAWVENSTIENCTVIGEGNVGNLIYLTTYNVNIQNSANCNNRIINNTVIGPAKAAMICCGIVLSGVNNTIDGNTINYTGTGITGQWGSGITGEGIDDNETSLVGKYNNKIYNNILYSGASLNGIANTTLINNTIYDNGLLSIGENNTAYNNTASNVIIRGPNAIVEGNNFTNTINVTGTNNNITHNTIITNKTFTITGRGTNNTITDNYLKALDKYGDESVNLNKETNTIANNTPKIELIIDTTEFTAGQNTTIQAGIYFDGEIITNITKGKVTFKVNGKTLKDANGKVIYAKIVNGTATIEDFTVPDTWKEGSTIQAVYSGSAQCDKLNSENENITINKEAPTLTIDPVEPATTRTTITLKAIITDNDKTINSGKIVFKINGKTLKDADGKVIYAKVVNGQVSVDYTIPETYKAGNYTITATYIGTDYDRLTCDGIINVVNA